MATQVIKSIGLTGRDYATLAAFFAAIPANLVTADQQWIGEVYNDGEIVTAGAQVLSGKTTDATRNVILRAAAGHSFMDHAGKATNPSAYDPAKGAALRVSDSFVDAFDFAVSFMEVYGLQFKTSGTAFINVKLGTSINFHNNIVHNVDGRASIQANGVSCRIDNNLVLHPAVGYPGIYFNTTGGSAANNTLYSSGSSSVGIAAAVAGMVYKNNLIFGFSGGGANNAAASSSNNYSDAAINAGTNNVTGLVLANVLVSTTNLRPKTGSVAINAGVAVSGLTTDLVGTAYSGGVDVGAYEYVSSGATINLTGATTTQGATSGTGAATVTAPVAGTVNLIGSTTTQGAASGTGAATVTGAAGTLTTRVFKNNSRTPQAGLANCVLNIYNAATGALVLRSTGLTTNGAGRLVVTNAALVAGTSYAYEADFSATSNGRRLPTAAAT